MVDHSLFLKHENHHTTDVLVYVYDIILMGTNTKDVHHFTTLLDNHNLGDITYFLDLEVARNYIGIHLNQRKYMLDLFQKTRMIILPHAYSYGSFFSIFY